MVSISIGDPALFMGGNTALFYSGLVAGILASVFAWCYANRRKSKDRRIGSPAAK